MRRHIFSRGRRDSLAGVVLAMLLFRAYIPVGFMPASGTPFLLQLCPAAFSMQMPAHHHHHPESHTHFDNCPFGSAPAHIAPRRPRTDGADQHPDIRWF
jgi:hypothetical protein